MFMTFGTKNRAECYFGTPYHAKALELEAKQSDLQAKETELAPLKFVMSGVEDPDEKKREQYRKEGKKLQAEWLRLQADMLRWKAKNCRKNDPAQKSNPFAGLEDLSKGHPRIFMNDEEEDYHCFYETPFQAKAYELRGKIYDLRARLNKLTPMSWDHGVSLDPDRDKRDRIERDVDEVRSELLSLKSKVMQWKAKKIRDMDKTQKGGFSTVMNGVLKALPPGPGDEPLDDHDISGAKKTPPKEYREEGGTSKEDYADPNNWKYPTFDEEKTRAAISYFAKPKNYGTYDESERKAVARRILSAAKKYKIDVSDEWREKFGLSKGFAFTTVVKGSLKNPKGTGVDVDTGMMPQMDLDVAAREVPAPELVNPDQPVTRKAKGDIFPEKEDLSKPVPEGKEVEHYVHKFKHGEPLTTTGKPPESKEQAIAIGMSEARKGKVVSKSFPLPVR